VKQHYHRSVGICRSRQASVIEVISFSAVKTEYAESSLNYRQTMKVFTMNYSTCIVLCWWTCVQASAVEFLPIKAWNSLPQSTNFSSLAAFKRSILQTDHSKHLMLFVWCRGVDYLVYYKNKNWLQFLFIVKAAVLKQQISQFYTQIQRTEASDHIYFSQRPFINVKAIFCA